MTFKDLPQKTFVESRMIFPTSVTPSNKNTENKSVQSTVLAEEKKVADDANRKRRRQKIFFVLTIIIFVTAQIFMYILLFKKWKQAIPKKYNYANSSFFRDSDDET